MAPIQDLVLFPHCDLHLILNGGHQLTLHAALRQSDDANPPPDMAFTDILPVPASGPVGGQLCQFQFFEPHAVIGARFGSGATGLPFADPITGSVTATRPGIFLFQAVYGGHAIVGRLQVHNQILEWRFGNRSVTTAMHPQIPHTQPSIYARFSDDGTGADLVGDITGHGYVKLTTTNPAIVTVEAHDRLHGHAEGDVHLTGSLPGGPSATIPVRSVRYDKIRQTLEAVQVGNATEPVKAHNMIFLAEGFPADKKELFDEIVTKVVDELFDDANHEPYPMLKRGFNAWKVFEPSQEQRLTCGFTINNTDIALPNDGTIAKGHPIPYQYHTDERRKAGMYTVAELVGIVGLPRRGESRDMSTLIGAWTQQSLAGSADRSLQSVKIDADLIAAWKAQTTDVLLEARDTYYGLMLGNRLADRMSTAAVPVPSADGPPAALPNPLASFVDQLYSFYRVGATRDLLPDPRRHSPALLRDRWNNENLGYLIMRYLDGQEWSRMPGTPIGSEVVPDFTTFKRSRGLVAIIAYDDMIGGSNFGNRTITAQTVNVSPALNADPPHGGPPWLLRRAEGEFDHDLDDVINTVAHEFGHSFNLHDEYEEHPNVRPVRTSTVDVTDDNVTTLGAVFLHGTPVAGTTEVDHLDGTIDPAKIKWAGLPRMTLSTMLIQDSEPITGGLKVTVDRQFIGAWVAARDKSLNPSLRNFEVNVRGQQLPLQTGAAHLLENLVIGGINEAEGSILLTSPIPPGGFFHRGSVLYIPKRDKPTDPLQFLLKEQVRIHLATRHLPLNRDPDTSKVNKEPDVPVDIANFNPPCRPYRVIGLFEGALHHTAGAYRPTGLCKMRTSGATPEQQVDGVFCHVCKWLIVNRVNPGQHAMLDHMYPEAKKNG